VATYLEDMIIETNFVTNPYSSEECSVYDDVAKISPLLKFITMLLAVFTSLLILCGVVICCHYCQLESKYSLLQDSVTSQMRQVGLPDDYEYDEDLQEVERREQLSYRERQREDGIILEDNEITQRANAMMMEEDSMVELGIK
jgi:hypothetical protein